MQKKKKQPIQVIASKVVIQATESWALHALFLCFGFCFVKVERDVNELLDVGSYYIFIYSQRCLTLWIGQ